MQSVSTVRRNSALVQNAVSSDVLPFHLSSVGLPSNMSQKPRKVQWFLLMVVMVFSLSVILSSKANAMPDECGPALSGCTWGAWIYIPNVVIPITVNGETCNITFSYKYRQCVPSNIYQYKVWGYTWPLPPCGIAAYLNNLKATDVNAYYAEAASIRAQAELPCGEHLFKMIRLVSPTPSDYDCLSPTGCTTAGLGNIEIQTFSDKCIEYIDVHTPPNPANGDPGCPGMTYFVECGSGQCCVRTRRMCYDNGNVRSCITLQTGYGAGQCTGNATFTPPSGCNIINRSGCINVTCE